MTDWPSTSLGDVPAAKKLDDPAKRYAAEQRRKSAVSQKRSITIGHPLKIAVFAHVRHPISEPFMGGMEAHCRMLCDGLRASGHDVALFAAGGSDDVQLVPICHAPYEDVLPWAKWRGSDRLAQYQRDAFEAGWEIVKVGNFDLVHNNSLFPNLIDWAARDGFACVTSHHVPPFEAIRIATERHIDNPRIKFTLPSNAQYANWRSDYHDRLHVVYNGIDMTRWTPRAQRAGYFVWSGRITPNKGTHHAIHAARLAGAALRLYGPVEDTDYFASDIAPYLNEEIAYLGHRSAVELASEVGSALGVLVTPLWDEPFGLVAAEALASGTPVCAFDNGALAEVVGRCGFIVPTGDTEALAHAMSNVWRINRDDCRTRAVQMFSAAAMIRGYERLYREATLDAAEPPQVVSA